MIHVKLKHKQLRLELGDAVEFLGEFVGEGLFDANVIWTSRELLVLADGRTAMFLCDSEEELCLLLGCTRPQTVH